MKRLLLPLCALAVFGAGHALAGEAMPLQDVHWNQGAADCGTARLPPLEVQAFDPRSFVLRENLCSTFEAPFMYLLIGTDKALLIDTGDVADAQQMPLAQTVLKLLQDARPGGLPLLVAHSHRHLDHRAGDAQFQGLPGVQVVPFDLDGMRRFFNFSRWPDGSAVIDLGGRQVDVLPAPGHNATELVFYDRDSQVLFSGDFLLPGRLLVDDADAYLASARRVAAFASSHPVRAVLGGHIEFDSRGEPLPWQSQYHPNEGALPLGPDTLQALPAALQGFNGFYSRSGPFVIMNPTRNLIAMATGVALVLVAAMTLLLRWLLRRRRARRLAAAPA